jgi:hypothetical protein
MFPVPACPLVLQIRIQTFWWTPIFGDNYFIGTIRTTVPYCKQLKKCLIQIFTHGDCQAPERISGSLKLDHI